MCLTLDALVVFLNLLDPAIVTTAPARIVVHAEAGDAHWVARGDEWCTMAPQIDRIARTVPHDPR